MWDCQPYSRSLPPDLVEQAGNVTFGVTNGLHSVSLSNGAYFTFVNSEFMFPDAASTEPLSAFVKCGRLFLSGVSLPDPENVSSKTL